MILLRARYKYNQKTLRVSDSFPNFSDLLCGIKLYVFRTEEPSETRGVLFQKNKFEKSVHLVGFIIRIQN